MNDVSLTGAADPTTPGHRVRHLPYLAYEVDRLADGRIIYFCPPDTAWLHEPGTGESWRFTTKTIQWDVVLKLRDAAGPVSRTIVRRLVRALQAVRKGDEPDHHIPYTAGGGMSTARVGCSAEVLLRAAKWTGRLCPYVAKETRTFRNVFAQNRLETAPISADLPLMVKTAFLGIPPDFSLINAPAKDFRKRMATIERLFYELETLDGGRSVLLSKPGGKTGQ